MYIRKKSSKTNRFRTFYLEAPTRFELVIEVLQTFALPLGYGALVTPRGFEPLLPP